MKAFRGVIPLLAVTAMLSAPGCARQSEVPRDRLGSLPYPGLFSLYATADPAHLGEHRCEREPRWFHTDEAEHGIIYTTRAGFVDLAHVRISIDTTRYCAERIREAIAQRIDLVALSTIEGSTFYVSLKLPDNWPPAADDQRERLVADEVAIRAGQRVAYLMMVWHEVITWFGYGTVAFLDESQSAFTYDDTMSHVVGVRVAGRALRDKSGRPFDETVTLALQAELDDLGAVSPAETNKAVWDVEGIWWSVLGTSKRNLAIGLTDGMVRPWIVPGLDPDHTAPDAYELPNLNDVRGRDFSSFYSARVDPRIFVAYRMREALPSHPRLFDCDRDFPLLLETMRHQMAQHHVQVAPEPALVRKTAPPPPTAAAQSLTPARAVMRAEP